MNNWNQFCGCSRLGTCSGNLAMCGAAERNFSTCKQDKLSARILRCPAMCLARNMILFCRQTRTSSRKKDNSSMSFVVLLFMTCTTASLSEKKIMLWSLNFKCHIFRANTIGNNSRVAIFLVFHDSGHSP